MRRFAFVNIIICGFAAALDLAEAPERPGEWGYRPCAEHPAVSNPPAFVWRPTRGAEAYDLEVARDAAFAEAAYRAETPWSAHRGPEALAPGTYQWRYRARTAAGETSGWSSVRAFAVTEELPVEPKPAPEDIAARVPGPHPRLFLRPEEIEAMRALAHGPLAGPWAAVRAKADAWLASPPDASEPPLYPAGIERKGETWKKIWWGNHDRSMALGEAAATLAFAYLISGEAQYAEGTRALMRAFASWDPKGATQYDYNDEAAMPLIFLPSRAYTWAYEAYTEEERAAIRAAMSVRAGDCLEHLLRGPFLWKPYDSHANRAWHWLGEAAIAFHGELPEAVRWLDYALTVYYATYPAWGVDSGGWHEGPGYWASYLERFVMWCHVSQSALGIDPFARDFFRRTGDYALYVAPPGAKHGGFGDMAQTTTSARLAQCAGLLALGARNPAWHWYAQSQGAGVPIPYLGFLYRARAGDLAAVPPADWPASRAFEDVGLAVLNTDLIDGTRNVQVQFKSSPYGRQSHGYNANNAFAINVHGQALFHCSGRRDVHGSKHHTGWMWETKSDNAILVNGKGQRLHSPDARGRLTAFGTSHGFDHVAGEAGEAYMHLDRWTRRILFFKPDVVVIHDVLDARDPSIYQWLLHASAPFEIDGARAVCRGASAAGAVHFLAPAGLALSQSDQFDIPPASWAGFNLREWHLRAETAAPAAQQEYVTAILLQPEGTAAMPAAPALTGAPGGYILRVPRGDGEAVVRLTRDRATVQGAGIDAAL